MTIIKKFLSILVICGATAACRHDPKVKHSFYGESHTEQSGENPSEDTDCGLNDGTYTADVVCTSTTAHQYADTPEVEVQDCRLVRIYYPGNHRRDETNMDAVLIGKDSNAVARDHAGNEYRVHITHGAYSSTKAKSKTSGSNHICGHATRNGTSCQRKVKSNQKYCWQHQE